VTVKANERTKLERPDTFSFGNLIGETGDSGPTVATPPRVNALDLTAVRRALNTNAPLSSPLDHNRDGRINALDLAAVRSTYFGTLTPPPPPGPGPAPTPAAVAAGAAIAVLAEDDTVPPGT
jgi:hypothetical protein